MEKEQSSIEWYAEQLARIGVTEELIGHLTNEAKAMHEKEQSLARIEENESMFEYAKTHGDARMILVLNDRINTLKNHVQ